MDKSEFAQLFSGLTTFKENRFHALVWILGEPQIGENVGIGAFSAVNATRSKIVIGDHCDIASFVSINGADSHRRVLGLADEIERKDIVLEHHVFVGSHAMIKGGAHIGHHTVIAAGTIVEGVEIPPYSLVTGNPMCVKAGYYREQCEGAAPAPRHGDRYHIKEGGTD